MCEEAEPMTLDVVNVSKGVSAEMLCKLARTEFRDNYDDQKKILELVVGKSLTPTLKKDGFILKDNVEHDTVTARLLPTGDRVQEILEDE